MAQPTGWWYAFALCSMHGSTGLSKDAFERSVRLASPHYYHPKYLTHSHAPPRPTHSHTHHHHSANANDAPKWTCGLHLLREPCVVFAWGSKDALDFEARVREWAPCVVHVFDPSTPSGSLPPSQVGACPLTAH